MGLRVAYGSRVITSRRLLLIVASSMKTVFFSSAASRGTLFHGTREAGDGDMNHSSVVVSSFAVVKSSFLR